MSYIVSRFIGKESDLDLIITNRAYRLLHSAFLDYLSQGKNELRLVFERTFAIHGVILEAEMHDDLERTKQYVLVWDNVIARLLSDDAYFAKFLGELGTDKSFLFETRQKIAGWKADLDIASVLPMCQ